MRTMGMKLRTMCAEYIMSLFKALLSHGPLRYPHGRAAVGHHMAAVGHHVAAVPVAN